MNLSRRALPGSLHRTGISLLLLIVPVGLILWRTFAPGIGAFFESITTPAAVSALQLSLLVVAIVVPLNVLFGVPTESVRGRWDGSPVFRFLGIEHQLATSMSSRSVSLRSNPCARYAFRRL